MISQMNKHINHLSMPKLMGIEKKEHGLKKAPTPAEQAKREMKEHGLKQKPSLSQMIMGEEKEHRRGNELVIGRGHEGRARKSNGKMR